MEEVWKSVAGYEGLYEVSNLGNIRSLPRKNTVGKLLKPLQDKDGYNKVCLYKGGKCKKVSVHRIVAQSFICNPNNLPSVNHLDEDKQNNRADNLEWCTTSYNNQYNGAYVRRGLSRRKPINQYTISGEFVQRWSGGIEIEQTLGFDRRHFPAACSGKLKTAYGYKWRYANE